MKRLNAIPVLVFVLLLLPFVATQSSTEQNGHEPINAIVKCGVGKFFYSGDPAEPNKNQADKGERFTWHIIVDKLNTNVTFDFGAKSPFGTAATDRKFTVPATTKQQKFPKYLSSTAGEDSYHYTITCEEPATAEVIDPIIEVPRKP